MISNVLTYMYMIRKNPCHDTETPAGTWVNPDLEKSKKLEKISVQTLGQYVQLVKVAEQKDNNEGTLS
jgi:hypothetical protein